ncbi:hypothetical protein [Marivita sp.]|uniref:hypothetical protein n=1 Tax=Marivita sp. TaxID=2003365 RepID=UPI003F6AE186
MTVLRGLFTRTGLISTNRLTDSRRTEYEDSKTRNDKSRYNFCLIFQPKMAACEKMKDVVIQSFWTILFFFILAAPSLLFCRKYSIAAHWSAFSKAFFLWLISSSPVIAAILMSKPDSQIENVPEHIQRQFLTNFSITEMFVYSASFLSRGIAFGTEVVIERGCF